MASLWDLRRTWRENSAQFSSVRNFHFATLGLKESDGEITAERSIKIYVRNKQSETALKKYPAKDRIPKYKAIIGRDGDTLGRVKTDVCVAPKAYGGFGVRSGHAVLGFDNDRGVCALSFLSGGRKYLITNSHVVIDIRSGGIFGSVSLVDRSTGTKNVVGDVVHATNLKPNGTSKSDFAIVRIKPAFVVDNFMQLDATQEIDKNEFEGLNSASMTEYSYNVSGTVFRAARAEPVMGFAPVRVDGVIVNYERCWLLHMTQGTGVPGHSGALLYRDVSGDRRACGLVFAGSEANRTILAYPFAPLLTKIENVLGAPIS